MWYAASFVDRQSHKPADGGDIVAVKTSNWQAEYLPNSIFSVEGRVHAPDKSLSGAVGYIETKPSLCLYNPPSEDVTILRLYLMLNTRMVYNTKDLQEDNKLAKFVHYQRKPLTPEESRYAEVHIFYEGTCIKTISVTLTN